MWTASDSPARRPPPPGDRTLKLTPASPGTSLGTSLFVRHPLREVTVHVADVLRSKGSNTVQTISPQATVQQLVDVLAERNIGATVVSDDGERVLGIISERDVIRLLRSGGGSLQAAVGDVMTTDVHVCEPKDSIEDLMRVMTDRRVRHVPVLTDGRLAGLVSIGDAVKARMSDLEFERDQLSTYVTGG